VAAARTALAPLLDGGDKRLLVGIAGPPAAGKSTLATTLARDLCQAFPRHGDAAGAEFAVAVGMDGFHLANSELNRLGLNSTKGAPDTFDAYGFIALLRRLKTADEPVVYAPVFSRTLNESIGSAQPVRAGVRVVVIEGNYLLVGEPAKNAPAASLRWSGARSAQVASVRLASAREDHISRRSCGYCTCGRRSTGRIGGICSAGQSRGPDHIAGTASIRRAIS